MMMMDSTTSTAINAEKRSFSGLGGDSQQRTGKVRPFLVAALIFFLSATTIVSVSVASHNGNRDEKTSSDGTTTTEPNHYFNPQQGRQRSRRRRTEDSPSRLHMKSASSTNSGEYFNNININNNQGGDIGEEWVSGSNNLNKNNNHGGDIGEEWVSGSNRGGDIGEEWVSGSVRNNPPLGGEEPNPKLGNLKQTTKGGDIGEWTPKDGYDFQPKAGNNMMNSGRDYYEWSISSSSSSRTQQQQKSGNHIDNNNNNVRYGGDAGEWAIYTNAQEKNGNDKGTRGGDIGEWSPKDGYDLQPNKAGNNMRYGGDAGEWAIDSMTKGGNRFKSNTNEDKNEGDDGPLLMTQSADNTHTYNWNISPNSDVVDLQFLAFEDLTSGTTPFGIAQNAPNHTLFLDSKGKIGIGTCAPQTHLHVYSGTSPSVRMEEVLEKPNPRRPLARQFWDIVGDQEGFYLYEQMDKIKVKSLDGTKKKLETVRTVPFHVQSGAPSISLVVTETGDVGVGTDSPTARLHVLGNARIDGDLQVGNHCYLNTNTCEWKANNQKQNGRNLRRTNPKQAFEEEEESIKNAEEIQELREQRSEDRETISQLQSTVRAMHEQQLELVAQMKALQSELQSMKQEQQQ